MTTTLPAASSHPDTLSVEHPPPLHPLLDLVAGHLLADPALAPLLDDPTDAPRELDVVASAGAQAVVLAAIARRRPVLAVTATAREADELVESLAAYLPATEVAAFPAWETLPHERLSPRSDTVARRLTVLRRLAGEQPPAPRVVVASIRAFMQPFAAGLEHVPVVAVAEGDEVAIDDLARDLLLGAYRRVDMVERRGEFAVRGGIVDVFAPTDDHPVRVEFFGDTVDELRTFSVADQRSLTRVDRLVAPPCRELMLTDDVRARARTLADRLPGARDVLEKVAEGIGVEGMEALLPVLVDRMVTLLDIVPDATAVVTVEPERVRTRAADLVATGEEFLAASWENAVAGAATPIDLREMGTGGYRSAAAMADQARARGLARWGLTALVADVETRAGGAAGLAVVDSRDVRGYRGDLAAAAGDLATHVRAGWRIVATTPGHGPAQRLVEVLGEHELAARLVESLPPADSGLDPSVVHVTCAPLTHGFVSEPMRLVVLTETDLAGQRTSTRDMRKMPSRRRHAVDPETLRPGDFVVHETHGIGRFVEMTQRVVQGATREYLVLEYAPSRRGQPGDRVYVPSDALDQVSRYVGGEAPSLSRMGGADWAKAKGRARKAVKQIAGELIQLYSARMASKGHAFGADTVWQRELEDAFPYTETPDQLATIDEVKRDMEQAVPMDRLVCGDVGYGKTEIALRAAFKAVMDGKQAAVLVPTTLLVQQHLATLSERYAGFPVTVRGLSRFSTDADARLVREGLADGSVDVVVGTHRLLSNEIRFKDLGLVVVDEEQRFGVDHKEALKKLRTNVDVLAMSATPIPRTLEMAVTGIREMSTLATPPEERHPILTYVGPYDERQVAAAVRRELLREGQVFFVHNRVESIDRAAKRIAEAVPEARVRVAHGQMNEHELERTVLDFWERRFDVLVCTTIVESGLDISNANTLIVDRADRLGLSQLHQLRGRVGRGRERGYAYFMWDREHTLSETAHDRLSTIAAHTELGSGMQVALKDLEIRGAGNLLGGEQSGHIAGVGFDLYLRMVAEAVADFRRGMAGEEAVEEVAVSVDVPVDAYLPHDYVPSERLRLEVYRRLAGADSVASVEAVGDELRDRFGAPGPQGALPEPVSALLEVARFRVEVGATGLRDVAVAGRHLRLGPLELPESGRMRLTRLYPGSIVKQGLSTVLVPLPKASLAVAAGGAGGAGSVTGVDLLAWARDVVTAIVARPAGAQKGPVEG
ncbi:MAG: transcription-repair coupling factor [Actinomycetales bacterium]